MSFEIHVKKTSWRDILLDKTLLFFCSDNLKKVILCVVVVFKRHRKSDSVLGLLGNLRHCLGQNSGKS